MMQSHACEGLDEWFGSATILLSSTNDVEACSALTSFLIHVQGTEERSQALNEAYGMLTEMSAAELASYERELRIRGPPGNNLK